MKIRLFKHKKAVLGLRLWAAFGLSVGLTACANMTGGPGGGPKDELAPVMVMALPEQGATNFQGGQVLLEFDEFIELREVDKIYASPVLKEADYSYNLKKVKVVINDTLRPDYTYTINFGKSLVDLHEANPFDGFQYVFSTGPTVDSMFLTGRVVKAVDYQPEDRVRLLFYTHRPDSFPFADEPDYVSIGDKDGYFQVNHMKAGCYFVYAVVDENQDYRIDPVTERMAYTDTCVSAKEMVAPTVEKAGRDTLATADSLAGFARWDTWEAWPGDTLWTWADTAGVPADSLPASDSLRLPDSLPVSEPSLELYLYQDYLPAFFLKEVSFKKQGQLTLSFYYPIDSLVSLSLIASTDSTEEERTPLAVWQWNEARRSAEVSFNDYAFYAGEVVLSYKGYSDTSSVYLPESARRPDTAMFRISVQGKKVLAADTLIWQSDMPLIAVDPDRLQFWQLIHRIEAVRDTVWLSDTLPIVDTLPASDTLPVYRDSLRGSFRFVDTVGVLTDTLPVPFEIVRLDDWRYGVVADKSDSGSYVLFLQDSAVFDFLGRPNDTADCLWETMPPEEEPALGDLALEISGLENGAIYVLQLVEGKDQVVQTVRLTDTATVEFLGLKPAIYTFRLLKDDNDNGRWDEGDYVRRIQPEQHWYYHKNLRVEADWRIEDIWRVE